MRQFPDLPATQSDAGTSATRSTATQPAPATLDSLTFAPKLIVWAAREWWQDRGDKDGSLRMISQAFTLAGCAHACTAFDEVMLMALHGACRHLDFAVHHQRLGADELALLRVLTAFQDEAVIGGEKALESWLPPATARLAVDPTLVLARSLGRAGLYVRTRQQN